MPDHSRSAAVADFTAAHEDTDLMGYLVFYSIYQTEVTPDELAQWFDDLGLDEDYLPPPLRADDAFERVTGPKGLKLTYPIDAPEKASRRETRATATSDRQVTLMTRPVQRNEDHILRHLVREERNNAKAKLAYKTSLAKITFTRGTEPGEGTVAVTPDDAALKSLRRKEVPVIKRHLKRIEEAFEHACRFYASDRLRALTRDYIERELTAIPLRPSGGVYFVPASHAAQLDALRDLVDRFGGNSGLTRVPIPDTGEMHDMVGPALTAKVTADLDRLAEGLAGALTNTVYAANRDKQVERLSRDFQAVVDTAREHAQALRIGLDEIDDRLKLTSAQFMSLLMADPGPEETESQED